MVAIADDREVGAGCMPAENDNTRATYNEGDTPDMKGRDSERTTESTLHDRARQGGALADFGRRALREADPDRLLAEAVALVITTLDVEFAKVLELLPGGTALRLRAGIGWRPGLVGQAEVAAGADSQAGYTLLRDEPVLVEDLRAEARFRGMPFLHEHGGVSGRRVIFGGRGEPVGGLGAPPAR